MEPWSVEAWIAFLELLVSTVRATAWPMAAVLTLLVLRKPLKDLIGRVRRLTPNSAEFSPIEQRIHSHQDGLTAILSSNYGPEEDHLRPWLHRIREDIRGLDEAQSGQLSDLLVRALAQAQQRADFFDILMRSFDSQLMLLTELCDSRFVTGQTIDEYHDMHAERSGTHALSKAAWLQFLTFYRLANGDAHRLEATIHGADFVEFIRSIEYQPSWRPF